MYFFEGFSEWNSILKSIAQLIRHRPPPPRALLCDTCMYNLLTFSLFYKFAAFVMLLQFSIEQFPNWLEVFRTPTSAAQMLLQVFRRFLVLNQPIANILLSEHASISELAACTAIASETCFGQSSGTVSVGLYGSDFRSDVRISI